MKKFNIEDMKVIIRYTDKKVDKDKLYNIFANIIKRIETQDTEKKNNENKIHK